MSSLANVAPGVIRVIKRDGTLVEYDQDKIEVALSKGFIDTEGETATQSTSVRAKVKLLAKAVTDIFDRRLSTGGTVSIEDIQDQVELALMRTGEHKVARDYVLFREKRAQSREVKKTHPTINVIDEDGNSSPLDITALHNTINDACEGLDLVSSDHILEVAMKNLYDGVKESDLKESLVMTARALIEKEPNYNFVTARLLLGAIRREGLGFLGFSTDVSNVSMESMYSEVFKAYIAKAIDLELISENLSTFDLDFLGDSLLAERDYQFTYLGLQTLYDRYFIHSNDVRFELPQIFFMRVAMGLAQNEEDKNARAVEFYRLLSSFDYMSSTPTLFNSGTLTQQLSSCYLTTIPDDLHGIYGSLRDNAMLSKWAGGLGNDWTPVRALSARIKGTNGRSQGIVPFMKVANDTAVAVNQGGKRKGAVCGYLETWHLDLEEFLELRKNTGDDRRRTHDMNTANWVPDLFMKRVMEGKDWTLFTPNEVPDLHDLYGKKFEEAYVAYEADADSGNGKIKTFKRVSAPLLWRKMLGMLFETGHPWITFKDPCNIRSPQQHAGVVHSSNLCTEITLNTSQDEIAVCNLGSINIAQHIVDGKLDTDKLKVSVITAIRMLDNVIDINFYPVETARQSNMKHRPIGLGLMGFQDALNLLDIPYASDEAVKFADESMEHLSYFAIEASNKLAQERGFYSSYAGSLWSKGILPIDSIKLLKEERGAEYVSMDESSTLDWDSLRAKVMEFGMRNSNLMAIAPTATISNITGVTQSIEPTYQNLYVKSNLSGEFTVVNPHMVRELKAMGLWDKSMISDLKFFEGSLKQIKRIPDYLKLKYATAFEVEPKWIIEAASRRQKWIDQAQSLNLYIDSANGKKLDITYKMAWLSGLKTTYYLRALAATSTEKSTYSDPSLNKVSSSSSPAQEATPTTSPDLDTLAPAPVPKACSISEPDCNACE